MSATEMSSKRFRSGETVEPSTQVMDVETPGVAKQGGTIRKKGAFANRKKVSAQRAPLVECKKKEIEPVDPATDYQSDGSPIPYGVVPVASAFVQVPEVWQKMQRGIDPDQMVGRDLFLKWLHVKKRLSFAHIGMLEFPYRVRVRCIHGWVMLPGFTPAAGDNTDYEQEVRNVIDQEFSKILAGPDKSKVRVLSDRTITRGTYSVIDGQANVQVPRRSEDLHFKWSPMRKVRYDQELKGSNPKEFLPEPTAGLWIPFYMCWDQSTGEAPVLSPNGSLKAEDTVRSQKREEMYFTDS